MIELHATIDSGLQLSAQVEDAVTIDGSFRDEQTQLEAKVKEGASLTARLLPAVILCACLSPAASLEARFLPPEWMDGTPANLITADGYFIRTADGYLLSVQDM